MRVTASCRARTMRRPSGRATALTGPRVSGLTTSVPRKTSSLLSFRRIATKNAMIQWKPRSGVKAMATPIAKEAATFSGSSCRPSISRNWALKRSNQPSPAGRGEIGGRVSHEPPGRSPGPSRTRTLERHPASLAKWSKPRSGSGESRPPAARTTFDVASSRPIRRTAKRAATFPIAPSRWGGTAKRRP